MKWFSDPLEDYEGEIRIIHKFLWFPVCLYGEWRWFETDWILQQIMKIDVGGSGEWGKYKHYWVSIKWIKD